MALVHLDTTGQSERVVDALCATATDTDDDIAEMETDEAMTHAAAAQRPASYYRRWLIRLAKARLRGRVLNRMREGEAVRQRTC